jgi:hypothetical protein
VPMNPMQGGLGYVYMVNMTIDEGLVDRVRRGEYEVDAHAVAEAMMRRWSEPQALGSCPAASARLGRARADSDAARIGSFVLVAPQALDEPAVGSDEGEPGAGPDVT